MENTGVMPLPPANSRNGPSRWRGLNTPAGGITSTSSPACRWSHSQLEPRPSLTRLTVTRCGSPVSGELASE
jgi:hypothetical protein